VSAHLGDNSNLGAEVLEADLANVDAVDLDNT
jgi:hypothetical protein